MNGYPFLDNKLEFHHTTVAADVMRPRPTEKDPLWALPQDSMTVEELEHVVQSGPNGFPIVVSRENQYLVGFVLRKELQVALGRTQCYAVISAFQTDTLSMYDVSWPWGLCCVDA